ncbi:LysR family transcriptional regulator [Ruminococcaceae bacterium OttesenSCG-928-D13]|nr:LysR family transcriptional regulator [Ruminococcaceae bacterium OttesenSCG-928-D13]
MQYPYLKYFIITAEHMSISKAAEAIHISQQGLSSYIRRLESYYQVELFTRKPELVLTPAGKTLLEKAVIIDQAFEELERELLDNRGKEQEVNVAIITPALRYVRESKLLVQYRDYYPDTLVQMEDLTDEEILKKVVDYSVDIGITNELIEDKRVEYHKLFTQRFVLAISDKALRKYIPDYPHCIEEFKHGVFLKDFLPVPYYGYPDSYAISRILKTFCEQQGITFATQMKNPSPKSSVQLVALGHGFAILVKDRLNVFRKEAKNLGLSFHTFPILEPVLDVPYYLVRRADYTYLPHIQKLMELIQSALK